MSRDDWHRRSIKCLHADNRRASPALPIGPDAGHDSQVTPITFIGLPTASCRTVTLERTSMME